MSETLIVEPIEEAPAVTLVPCPMTVGELRRELLRFDPDAEVTAALGPAGDVFFASRLKLARMSSEVTLHPDGPMTQKPRLVLLPTSAFEVPQ